MVGFPLSWCVIFRRAFAGALAALALVLPAQAAERDAPKWAPWFEAGGYISTERSRGESAFWMPFLQGPKQLLFMEFKGKLFEDDISEGNFALGYRKMLDSGWNFGAWLGADVRRTTNNNTFRQVAGGLEFLSHNIELRANGYLPIDHSALVSRITSGGGAPTVGIVGTAVVTSSGGTTTTTTEFALWGVDGEVGLRVPLERFSARGGSRPNHELRLYAGGFYYDDDDTPVVAGPRFRAQWLIDDIIARLPGSQLSFETEYQYDNIRKDQFEVGIRLRIPLGRRGSAAARVARLTPQERRMNVALERDTDIVSTPQTVTVITGGGGAQTPITDAGSGEAINVYHVANSAQGAGDCSSPANACQPATALGDPNIGPGDILVPVDIAGIIASNIALNAARQQIVGGGGAGTATLVFTDAAASTLELAGLGGRATLNGQVTLFQDANVRGFDINNTNVGGHGIFAQTNLGLASANVSDMNIRGQTNGVRFEPGVTGTANFTADVAVTGTAGGAAVAINGGSGSVNFSGSITQNFDSGSVGIFDHTGGTLTFSGPINQTSNNGSAIFVQNVTGGTVTFSNATKNLSVGIGNAVALIDNTGATINFTGGGLNIDVTGGFGFTTRGGGTLNITGPGNTLDKTADLRAGVEITSMTIGGSGVTFQSVTTSGAEDPIVLSANTGGTITFDTVAITNSTTDAVVLSGNTAPVVISGGTINGFVGDGVDIRGAGNVTLNNLTITDADAGDFGVHFNNTTATVSGTGNTTAGGVTRCLTTGPGAPTGTISIDATAEPGGVC